MRPTSLIGVIGLVIVGVIIADVLANSKGTTAAAGGVATIMDPTYNALLGQTTTPSSS